LDEGDMMNWKAEILNLGEGEKKGSFFLTLMGQIRYDFKVIYTETRTFEIDLEIFEQTYGAKDAFIEYATDTLKKYLDNLIEQKFKNS
jgi:hypothetical protein